MVPAVGPVAQKEAKYTQGFEFRLDSAGEDRARQLVERSCTSLLALLQELFLQVERQGMDQLRSTAEAQASRHVLECLSDVAHMRAHMERAVLDAVVCAFAALEDHLSGESHNRPAIDRVLATYKSVRDGEHLELARLFQANERIIQANNQDRPLLVHLNAQLAVVFGAQELRLRNSPLSPATLTGGLLMGLATVQVGMAAREMLFRAYETHFLPRLTLLLNSMTMRLEEEGVQILRAASFDEMDPGPVVEVLRYRPAHSPESLDGRLKSLLSLLEKSREYRATPLPLREKLCQELKAHSSTGSAALFSDLSRIKQVLESPVTRAEVQAHEVAVLAGIRRGIADRLNADFAGRRMPSVLRDFLCQQWAGVWFEVAVREGLDSPLAHTLAQAQGELVDSVTPLADESRRGELSRAVPRLVRTVRELLEQAGYTLADTHDFFEQLKQLHLANVQQKLDPSGFVSWEALSLLDCVPQEVPIVSESDRALYEQARILSG